jgi:hypothetical protein
MRSRGRVWLVALAVLGSATSALAGADECTDRSCRVRAAGPLIADFKALGREIAGLPPNALDRARRQSLQQKLTEARSDYAAGRPCGSLDALEAYLAQSEAIRMKGKARVGEYLRNRGWELRLAVLEALRAKAKCFDPDAGAEPRVPVGKSTARKLEARIVFGEPELVTDDAGGERWTQVTVPGAFEDDDRIGLPAVQFVRRLVAVPQGARLSVEARPKGAQTIPLNLFPVQDQAPMSHHTPDDYFDQLPPEEVFADPPFARSRRAYKRNAPYPQKLCTARSLGTWRDLQIAQIECAAGRYRAKDEKLTLFESLQLELSFKGGSGQFISRESLGLFEGESTTYRDAVINKAVIDAGVSDPVPHIKCTGEELVVLTHPDLRPAADTLAQWKNDKGIPTSVFNVNDGPGPGPDTAAEINAFVSARYHECHVRPSYVMLFGDAEYVPTFYEPYPGHEDDRSPIATDFPYTQDAANSGDLGWEFAVGRIPVDAPQADAVAQKLIAYEQDPPFSPYLYGTASIASQFECCQLDTTESDQMAVPPEGTDKRAFIRVVEDVRDRLLDENYAVDRIYTKTVSGGNPNADPPVPPYTGDPTPKFHSNGADLPPELQPPFPWDGNTADIKAAWEQGRFLMIHLDHGGSSGWSHPHFVTSDANGLTNGPVLPFVLGFNCSSGYFDNETDGPPNDPLAASDPTSASYVNFSEALIRNPNGGAIGTIAATRTTFAHGNIMIKGSLDSAIPEMDAGFGGPEPNARLGDMLNHARIYMLEKYGENTNTERHWFLYNLLGDPTLEMHTGMPYELPRDFVAIKFPDFIHVDYGFDGATITAWQETPDGVRAIGRGVVQGGVARISYFEQPLEREPIKLSADAEGAVPRLLGETR